MRSVMKHNFSQVPKADIQRSQFDRSHGLKTTFNGDYLIPVFVDEALPGDTFNVRMTAFARLATPLKPYMDNARLQSFFFAVPKRLVWDNFKKQMGERKDPNSSVDYLTPILDTIEGGLDEQSLGDYFGIPTKIDIGPDALEVTSLVFRADSLIFNEWFRDQNIQQSLVIPTDDGPDDIGLYNLKRINKQHDYFTSSLPWPQKGDDVLLPLGERADIALDPDSNLNWGVIQSATNTPSAIGDVSTTAGGVLYNNNQGYGLQLDPNGTLYADLQNATAASINDIREAFAIQKLYERDARGGTRYTELVRSHFQVVSPDARQQRPEYLGGGITNINVHPIANTTGTTENPQGNLAAFATAAVQGHGFVKSFTEHTIVLGYVAVRADLTYQQGLNKMWSRRTKLDYYWPALSHIGEQAVLRKEIFANGIPADDEVVFGYQERYAEYRYKPSLITGKMRSNATASLDLWHLSQDFATAPLLSTEFIESDTPWERVVAVTDEPEFIMDAYFDFKAARPMPVYGTPGLIDHF